MPSRPISTSEQADITFLLLAVVAALALAFAAGNYWSVELVSRAIGGFPSEGGKGFTANFGLFASSVLAVLTGGVAAVHLCVLFMRRLGSVSSWQRIVGYLLLGPYLLLFLRILWVRLFH